MGRSLAPSPRLSDVGVDERQRANRQDDGIIKPSDTRDVLGLALELADEERAGRIAEGGGGGGGRGEIGAEGDSGGWGVFRM